MEDKERNLILVVDDELLQMRALCDTLEDNGYHAIGFANGKDALAAMEETQFDVLLADLSMPEMDGIELLRRAHDHDPDMACVIMTGHATVDTAVEAMKTGALDYILKPFRMNTALQVLTRALIIRRLRRDNAALERRVHQHVHELETANKDLESFAYSVSHDLKAPVRAISGFSQMLLESTRSLLTEQDRNLLQRITRNAQHMSELIEGLLALSRSARQASVQQNVEISALVTSIVDDLRREHGTRQIEVRIGYLPDVTGDPALLRQVFVNLLSNAFKFTRGTPQTLIEVDSLLRDDERIYFVRDNGAGFDMQHADKLFGVFQRLHSHADFEGSGVGLSIVQRIIKRHGGRIWAESKVGAGTTFYFVLGGANGARPDLSDSVQ